MSGPINPNDLTNTLNKRADDFARLGGHDLDLAQVVSRAGEIRRGRRMRASMMMAAVVIAVAAPVGLVVLNNDGPAKINRGPSTTTSTGTTPTQAPTPTQTPSSTRIDPNPDPIGLDGLSEGQATGQAYVSGSTLHYGAKTVALGNGQVSSVARIDGGFLVGQYDNQGETAKFLFDDGSDPLSWPMVDGSGFVVSENGQVGAFIQPDGQVIAVQDGGSRYFDVGTPLAVSSNDGVSVDAIQADSCTDRSETNVCTVWVTVHGQKPQVWSVSMHHDATAVFPGWLKLNDLSAAGENPLFAGQISSSDTGSCSQVSELAGDNVSRLWKTCDNSFRTFSPDGTRLLGGPAYGDGPGDGIVTILDARTGRVLSTIKADQQSVMADYVWEDDDHLLALVEDLSGQGRAGLVRIGLDGSRELVAPIVSLSDTEIGYRIGER